MFFLLFVSVVPLILERFIFSGKAQGTATSVSCDTSVQESSIQSVIATFHIPRKYMYRYFSFFWQCMGFLNNKIAVSVFLGG